MGDLAVYPENVLSFSFIFWKGPTLLPAGPGVLGRLNLDNDKLHNGRVHQVPTT